ncbi:MAG: sulfite exporter TauE/SafE family protein [Nesterenkonia sp.]
MESALISVVVIVATLVVAGIQRIVGFGFGMVMAPFLVLIMPPHEGVMLVNFLSIFAPILIMWQLRQYIEWGKFLWLAVPALLIMPAAAWLAVHTPPGPLYIVVAAVVLMGLVISAVIRRVSSRVDGRTVQTLTGIGAGAGTVLAGVGAPATTVYTVLSRWSLLKMIATLQPLWLVMSAAAFGMKWALDQGQLPGLPWWGWVGSTAAIVVGIYLGQWVQRRVSDQLIGRSVLALAALGAVAALFTGVRMTFFG